MKAEDIPAELVAILDKRAGKVHRPDGTVMQVLAELLTEYDRLKEPDPNQCRRIDPHGPHVWYQCIPNGKPGSLAGSWQAPEHTWQCPGHNPSV